MKLRKAFANGSSANIKLSKTQLHHKTRIRRISRKNFRTITKNWIAFASALATDPAIHKMFEYGFTKLRFSNEEANDIMKIVKSFEKSGLLIKRVSKTIKNEAKEKKMIYLYAIRYIRCYIVSKSINS